MRRVFKKGISIIGIMLGVLLLIVIIYFCYLFLSYKRIPDNQVIEIKNQGNVKNGSIALDQEYSIISYNIGFGAYSADYSFFMDGGEYERAYSKQSVLDNTEGALDVVTNHDPDFILFQEVDIDSNRSYRVNQQELLQSRLYPSSSAFAINYDSAYLFYPFLNPHGKSKGGILTLSKYELSSALRRSLPVSTSLDKIMDLDRCYEITKIPVENGSYLCLYNVHLSAYTKDESIVVQQIKMLSDDMKQDVKAGNYVICGGDFNQDLFGNSPEIFGTDVNAENWALPFQSDLLPEHIQIVNRMLTNEERRMLAPSCRNADAPYEKGTSFVTMIDGFLISDNISLEEFTVIDTGFTYSDHNPVKMKFRLLSGMQ